MLTSFSAAVEPKRLVHVARYRSNRTDEARSADVAAHGVAHLMVLPQSDLSSTFDFVTSGAGSWSSRMPGARCTIVLP